MEILVQNTAVLITAIGALAFMVSVIVEVLKKVPAINILPTDLIVIVVSLALTVAAFFAYVAYASIQFTWYYIVGAVLAGFLVSYVAMFGWDKLSALYKRFKK